MLAYRLVPLPTVWPGKRSTSTKRSPFKTRWTRTLSILERELKYLNAKDVQIAIDVRSDRDIRQDGQLRADARPRHPVILAFTVPASTHWDGSKWAIDKPEKRLQFPCDTYAWWEDNVYAIAMALENLRAVERWGVSQTSQYEGFRALPAQSSVITLTSDIAASIIGDAAGHRTDAVLSSALQAKASLRVAMSRKHPDAGGSSEEFQRLQEAKRALEAHFGAAL